jgi:hypothetical protein
MRKQAFLILAGIWLGLVTLNGKEPEMEGVIRLDFAGYKDCLALENPEVRVVLGRHCGGRVLEYAWKGYNVLALDPAQDGYLYQEGKPTLDPRGGRLDIGPEMIVPAHPRLWLGEWTAEVSGPRCARLSSPPCPATGVRLRRDFKLDKNSSRLTVVQTIENVSSEVKKYCHWSRTLLKPGGVCIVPLTPDSRYPGKYLQYQGQAMCYRPQDPNIVVKDGYLSVLRPLQWPKLAIDSHAGWLAYLLPANILFVKRFPTYPDRVYGEMAGFPLCVYYHEKFIELEPIGPWETIAPGKAVSYEENWWLLPYDFPKNALEPEPAPVATLVQEKAR